MRHTSDSYGRHRQFSGARDSCGAAGAFVTLKMNFSAVAVVRSVSMFLQALACEQCCCPAANVPAHTGPVVALVRVKHITFNVVWLYSGVVNTSQE